MNTDHPSPVAMLRREAALTNDALRLCRWLLAFVPGEKVQEATLRLARLKELSEAVNEDVAEFIQEHERYGADHGDGEEDDQEDTPR